MNLPQATLTVAFLVFSSFLRAQSSWPESLILTPEKSEFTKTSTYHDVIKFLDTLKSKSEEINLISMGKTHEGKVIPIAILSSPAVASPMEAKATGKPVVYIQGNIHGGEVEGKEALLMLMREILLGDKHHLLDNQILLFAPIYNADGNDKMEAVRRPSQEDSPLLVGTRENGQGLDLNRDGMKMEAPETRGLISLISTWDPQVFVDLHTTNGTWHAYDLTWAPSYHTTGHLQTYTYTLDMLKTITSNMEEKHRLRLGPYGEYHLSEGWPPKNFYTYNHHPRYLVNQFGLRNRMAILSEAFSHERFYQRINSTYQFVLEILQYTNTHAKEIESINKVAEEAVVQYVVTKAGKVKKGVRFKMESNEKLSEFWTYDYIKAQKADSANEWLRTGKVISLKDILYHATFPPILEATLPHGYIIPAEFSNVAELLQRHGVKVTKLTKSRRYAGESFMIDKLTKAEKKFEGHFMASAQGQFVITNQTFKKGDFAVDLAQPLSNLIFYLLEPQSDDGLLTWNFFDSYLEKHGVNNTPVRYPVFKYIH